MLMRYVRVCAPAHTLLMEVVLDIIEFKFSCYCSKSN